MIYITGDTHNTADEINRSHSDKRKILHGAYEFLVACNKRRILVLFE